MNKYLIVVIIILLAIIGAGWQQVEHANKKWETAETNIKAYDSQLGYEKKKNIALQLSVSQLKYFSDSVLQALDETRKELNIKDKNLKALQSISSSFSKKDTVYLDSIIFKEPSFALDTLIGDEWYSLRLGLKYPSMVAVKP